MTGEEIEESVFDWFRQRYPEGPKWQDSDFHCFRTEPLELKMLPVFRAIEYNLDNGGWSQLLWNCFGTWRQMIEIADEGYNLIGAHGQRDALKSLKKILTEDEAECSRFIRKAENEAGSDTFAEYTRRSYAQPGHEWQAAFYYDSGIHVIRYAWLEENAGRMKMIMNPARGIKSWFNFFRRASNRRIKH